MRDIIPSEHWTYKYLSLPYKLKGRGFDGVDCWGLVKLIYWRELQILLEDYLDEYEEVTPKEAGRAIEKNRENEFVEVTKPQEFDVVILMVRGSPLHVGVLVDVDKMEFIHISRTIDSSIESLNCKKWYNKVLGIVRHRSFIATGKNDKRTAKIH